MEESSESHLMTKLITSNYTIWKSEKEDLLFEYDFYELIEADAVRPSYIDNVKWENLNRNVVRKIK